MDQGEKGGGEVLGGGERGKGGEGGESEEEREGRETTVRMYHMREE